MHAPERPAGSRRSFVQWFFYTIASDVATDAPGAGVTCRFP